VQFYFIARARELLRPALRRSWPANPDTTAWEMLSIVDDVERDENAARKAATSNKG